MGGGLSSLPMAIDKDRFRKLTGGTQYDTLFDANAVAGVLSRDRLIELSQISDCYFCFDAGTDGYGQRNRNRVNYINDMLRSRGLSTSMLNERSNGPLTMNHLCSSIDKSRSVLLFLTRSYFNRVIGEDPNDYNKVQFNYAIRSKKIDQIIPIIMEEEVLNANSWPNYLYRALKEFALVNFSQDDDIQATFEQFYQRIDTVVRRERSIPIANNVQKSNGLLPDSTREEKQFFNWMERSCAGIDETRRINYCASLSQSGVTNVHALAAKMQQDSNFLASIGVNEYDADLLYLAVSDCNIGYVHKRDFNHFKTFESATFVLKKAIESPEDHDLAANALECINRIASSDPGTYFDGLIILSLYNIYCYDRYSSTNDGVWFLSGDSKIVSNTSC
jgi:hypothetical protein